MYKYAFLIFSLFLYCCSDHRSNPELVFFNVGELSTKPLFDSMRISYRSKLLKDIGQVPLRSLNAKQHHVRLIVSQSSINSYVIYINHSDSSTNVTYSISPDGERERMGLSHLELSYETPSRSMDSLYNLLYEKISSWDFYSGIDDPRDYDMVDGTGFLIERYINGGYRVAGGTIPCQYKGCSQMIEIFDRIHLLVPVALLPPDPSQAKSRNDLLFPVIQSRTCK